MLDFNVRFWIQTKEAKQGGIKDNLWNMIMKPEKSIDTIIPITRTPKVQTRKYVEIHEDQSIELPTKLFVRKHIQEPEINYDEFNTTGRLSPEPYHERKKIFSLEDLLGKESFNESKSPHSTTTFNVERFQVDVKLALQHHIIEIKKMLEKDDVELSIPERNILQKDDLKRIIPTKIPYLGCLERDILQKDDVKLIIPIKIQNLAVLEKARLRKIEQDSLQPASIKIQAKIKNAAEKVVKRFKSGALPNSVLVHDLQKAYEIIDGQRTNSPNNNRRKFNFEGATNGLLGQSEFQIDTKKKLKAIKRKGAYEHHDSTASEDSSDSEYSLESEDSSETGYLNGESTNQQRILASKKKHSRKKKEKNAIGSKVTKRKDKNISRALEGKDTHLGHSSDSISTDVSSFSSLSSLSFHESLNSATASVKSGYEEELELKTKTQQFANEDTLEIKLKTEVKKLDSVNNDTIQGAANEVHRVMNATGYNNSVFKTIKMRDLHSNHDMTKNKEKTSKKRSLAYKTNITFMDQTFDTKMIAKVFIMLKIGCLGLIPSREQEPII
jgi:hypothetical protein